MAARNLPGIKKNRVGARSADELKQLLNDRVKSSSSAPVADGSTVDIRKVPGSNQRRTGVPADTKSASARGTTPPNTYTARGKSYIKNPNDTKNIFLKNHPVLAGLKTTDAKSKFLINHPRIAKRATEVTTPKGPALAPKPSQNALMRRLRRKL